VNDANATGPLSARCVGVSCGLWHEFDIEGLVVSTGCWKRSQINTKMLEKLVDVDGKALPKLPRSCH